MKYAPALLAALLALTLTACAPTAEPRPLPSESPTATDTSPEADDSALQARIAELEAALLALKGERYVLQTEYEARIAALQSEIANLQALLQDDTSADTPDIPVSGAPDTPSADTAASEPNSLPFLYVVQGGAATILRYTGDSPTVTIPAAVEGAPVTAIGEAAFRGTPVTAVTLPDTVTAVGWFAFADCAALTAVTLPASVESIGYGAFDGCKTLILYCPRDSYAARYADGFGLKHTEP